MRHLHKLLYLGLLAGSFQACVKDTGNYEFADNDLVEISMPQDLYQTYLGQDLELVPTRHFKEAGDSVNFSHAWYINGQLVSEEPTLHYVPTEMTALSVKYYMTDKRTGVTYSDDSSLTTSYITSPNESGWGIL